MKEKIKFRENCVRTNDWSRHLSCLLKKRCSPLKFNTESTEFKPGNVDICEPV